MTGQELLDPQTFVSRATLAVFGNEVQACVPLCGGRNSQLYCVYLRQASRKIVCKRYFPRKGETNHQRVEYDALVLMSSNGISDVPRPLEISSDDRLTWLQHIEGERPESLGSADLEQILEFFTQLEIVGRQASDFNYHAAEAGIDLRNVVANLENRYQRLVESCSDDRVSSGENGPRNNMSSLLSSEIQPALDLIKRRLNKSPIARRLDAAYWRLSPSDFGSHNFLREYRSNKLAFLDFEYFGWDDPVKLTSDFLLHPETELSDADMGIFVEQCCKLWAKDDQYLHRLKDLFPVYGVKWSMILLNEFLSEHSRRRAFSDTHSAIDRIEVLKRQVEMSSSMLARTERLYGLLFSRPFFS